VTRRAAAWVAAIEIAIGAGLLVILGAAAAWLAALIAAILIYDWFHKRWTGSVLLMAGCRVLLAVAIASLPGHGLTPPLVAWLAVLFFYIVVLSLIARREYQPGAPAGKLGRAVRGLLAFIPLVDAMALFLVGAWAPALACAGAVPLGRYAQRLAASS
jgi:4-hydroxybenzoate polyprenyltransferase